MRWKEPTPNITFITLPTRKLTHLLPYDPPASRYPPPRRVLSSPQYHPGASVTQVVCTATFPPMLAACGLAPCFVGFGPAVGTGDSSDTSTAPALVQRVKVTPAQVRGAFQHVALFKNILVAAEGDASCTLRVFDVRDWSEKQKIRVGAVASDDGGASGSGSNDENSSSIKLVPAAVSVLRFDGTTIAAGTHEGMVHTWRLMQAGAKRGYVRLLQPLRVDSVPVTKVFLLGETGGGGKLLAAHSSSKRAFVVWELETGKLKGAFNTDAVALGVPLRITEACGTVLACVHADETGAVEDEKYTSADDQNSVPQKPKNAFKKTRIRNPVVAVLDVATGEGGALRDADALIGQGTPTSSAFDGELFVLGTEFGTVVLWNLATGDAPFVNKHGFGKTNAAVGAVTIVPGDPNRIVTGGADRGVILWNKCLQPLARMELGSQVACLYSSLPRVCVAGKYFPFTTFRRLIAHTRLTFIFTISGTAAGFVEVLSLCAPGDTEIDFDLRDDRTRNASQASTSSPPLQYELKHDSGDAASSYASFDAFTRRVPVWEGAYTPSEAELASRASAEKNKNKNASGFSSSCAMQGSAPTQAEQIASQKKEDEETKAKQRAMDGAGVARNPNVKLTRESVRRCSNPTCVERSDTMGAGQKMLRCSRCKNAQYCSGHCQRTHWRDGHKEKCVPPAMTEAAKETATETTATLDTTPEVDTDTARAKTEPKPETPAAPVRRALVVEDDSEDESDESDLDAEDVVSETTRPKQSEGVDVSLFRKSAVITGDGDASENKSKDDLDDSDGDDSDAPALPPWMTAHAPPVSNATTKSGNDAPPAVRKRDAVESEAVTKSAQYAGVQALDDDDLLYELD